MSAGVVDVIISEQLPYSAKKLVRILKQGLIADTLNPFDGELHSQQGLIKDADSPRLSYEEIIRMNWLNDIVIGAIPSMDQLTESAKATVTVSGVTEERVTPKMVKLTEEAIVPMENAGNSKAEEATRK